MGFLNDFAYGASTTIATKVQARAKAEAEADATIREKVASVQPMADLYARQKAIDEDMEEKKLKFLQDQSASSMADALTYIQGQNPNGQNQTSNSATPFSQPQSPSVANPAPTITAPSTPGFMNPPAADATQTMPSPFVPGNTEQNVMPNPVAQPQAKNNGPDPDEAYKQMQVNTLASNIALSRGDKLGAEKFKGQADFFKQQYDFALARTKEGPITSAEGINVGEKLSKDFEDHLKNPGDKSWYTTGNTDVPMSLPQAQDKEQEIFETIHAPLAMSFLNAQKSKYPNSKVDQTYSMIKNETTKATQSIVTLTSTDPHVTTEDKAAADKTLMATFKKVYGSPANLQAAIAQDPTLAGIIQKVADAAPNDKPSTTPATPAPKDATSGKQTEAIPTVTSDADYAAVSPGAQYKDPQGNLRTKKAQ